jgi:hypothetical protein
MIVRLEFIDCGMFPVSFGEDFSKSTWWNATESMPFYLIKRYILRLKRIRYLKNWLLTIFNPLAPGRPIIGREKKSVYIPRRPISAACETPFLDRSQRHVNKFKFWYYNHVSRCQMISSVECMRILHKLVYKVWPNFSFEFGGEIGYSRIYAQWHIIVRTWCVHGIHV